MGRQKYVMNNKEIAKRLIGLAESVLKEDVGDAIAYFNAYNTYFDYDKLPEEWKHSMEDIIQKAVQAAYPELRMVVRKHLLHVIQDRPELLSALQSEED